MKKIDLYEAFGVPRGEALQGYLTCYTHTPMREMARRRTHPAILVIPGGAYAMISERESEPVALQFLARGFDCFVLTYDVAPMHYPVQLLQAGMAMAYLRDHAAQLGIDGGHIAVMGFSAGGHLAGCLTLLWDDRALLPLGDRARLRPDAAVLAYPVVTSDKAFWHADSMRNFCADAVPLEAYSLEKHVRSDAPPVFLWATAQDRLVPVQNTLLLYDALLRASVSAELHVFGQGDHGLSTADAEINDGLEELCAHVAHWLDLATEFLKAQGFAVKY